jgi:hypothetical protein
MRLMKSIFAFVFIFLQGFFASAQEGWEAKIFGGYLVSHHPEMQNMEAHIVGTEINKFWTLTHSQKPFDGMKVGFSGLYLYLGKPNINGSALAFLPNVVVNLTPKAKTPFTMRWAAGLGYITKPFSYPNNIKNKAVGTHFNGCMQMQFNKYWVINKNYQVIAGGGLTHFSNGNFKKPNLGINMPHLILGMRYTPTAFLEKRKQIPKSNESRLKSLSVVAGYAKREVSIDDPKKIHIVVLGLDYKIPRRQGHAYRLGTDLFFDPSYPYQKFAESSTYKLAEIIEHGIRVGYEWQVNKMSLTADLGLYTYRPQKLKRVHYITIGLDYDITKDLSAFVKLKTHLSVADYFQWGLTYQFYER